MHPYDDTSLRGALDAAASRLIAPVLMGPEARIRALAAWLHRDLSNCADRGHPYSHAAAEKAVEMVRAGPVDALVKGGLHADELMAKVVRKDTGLCIARRITHVFIMDVPTHPKALFRQDLGFYGLVMGGFTAKCI
jgi:phosphate acetyltransferase